MSLRRWVPREHGAWAMWIIPLATGLVASDRVRVSHAVLFVGLLLSFLSSHALRWAVRNRNRKSVRPVGGTAALLAATGAALVLSSIAREGGPKAAALYAAWVLTLVGAVFTYISKGLQRTIAAELAAVALLTSAAPAAMIVGGRASTVQVLSLYAVNFLFFSLSIFYVKAKVQTLRRSLPEGVDPVALCLAYLAFIVFALALLVRTGWLEIRLILVFVPVIFHTLIGLRRSGRPVDVRRLGFQELAHSLIFLVGLILLW